MEEKFSKLVIQVWTRDSSQWNTCFGRSQNNG